VIALAREVGFSGSARNPSLIAAFRSCSRFFLSYSSKNRTSHYGTIIVSNGWEARTESHSSSIRVFHSDVPAFSRLLHVWSWVCCDRRDVATRGLAIGDPLALNIPLPLPAPRVERNVGLDVKSSGLLVRGVPRPPPLFVAGPRGNDIAPACL